MTPLLNLFKFEFRQNIKSLLTWLLVIGLILVLYSTLFPSFKSSDMMEIINAKMNAFPEPMARAMGLDSSFDFQNIMYFSAYMFQFIVIAMIFYATSLGSKILSKEHSGKHIDYLATKPIKKETIVLAKYLSFASLLTTLSLGIAFMIFIVVGIFKDAGDPLYITEILRMTVKLFSVYLIFGTISFMLTAFTKTTKKTGMLVMGLFFASYVLGVVSKMIVELENLKYLSPYYIFETVKSYTGFTGEEAIYLMMLLIVSAILLFASILRYKNKDLSLT